MSGILEQIIAHKRIEVEKRRLAISLDSIKDGLLSLPKCRNFYKAVTKDSPRGINVIAEVKKASPSAGLIRPDFDPVEIARIYQSCGADAVSVLTDEKYFQGKLEYLSAVSRAVDLPVLRKDFIVDEYQIYEARLAGADAILLIAEAFDLTSGKIMDFLITAAELSLTVLLEVHSADSLLAVRSLAGFPRQGYCVIGINNRNLATMQVDLNNTARMAELVGDDGKFISESGIKTRSDVEKLIAAGASAVLIGQTLCENENIDAKFAELFGM